jgi:protocatechuate 4,5-dioxygenase, alpha chain
MTHIDAIPGTPIFTGEEARKGYALNKMCFSFNEKSNRDAFLADEEGYMDRYHLNDAHKQALRDRNVLAMIAVGGNVYSTPTP